MPYEKVNCFGAGWDYEICPYCGTNLDFGERCECYNKENRENGDASASLLFL